MSPKRPPTPDDTWPQGIGAPARRALEAAGYTHLTQLTRMSEAELRSLHGMGPKALDVLRRALAAQGRSFAGARRAARSRAAS
jgi:predicted flap endonuclease-1-like 5' DNA nuclease